MRFEVACANMGFFNTFATCFRAGMLTGKPLKRMVSAESNLQPTDLLSRTKNKWFQRFPDHSFGNKWAVLVMVVTNFVTTFERLISG